MANTSDFKNGLIINHKNNLWKIIEFLHVKPGKGGAFVRSKLKNIRSGQVVEETFRAGEKIEAVRVEARNYNYLYSENNNYVFMDKETYEQVSLSEAQVEDVLDFLLENTETTIAFNGEEPIEVRIPKHMNFTVKDSIWLVGIVAAMFIAWGVMGQRVVALEKNVDKLEQAIITFAKMEVRLAVIETEVKNINLKLDEMRNN